MAGTSPDELHELGAVSFEEALQAHCLGQLQAGGQLQSGPHVQRGPQQHCAAGGGRVPRQRSLGQGQGSVGFVVIQCRRGAPPEPYSKVSRAHAVGFRMRQILVFGFTLFYLATCFGLRSWLHRRANGDSGFRSSTDLPALLFVCAVLLLLLGPWLSGPLWTPSFVRSAVGSLCALLGFAGTWYAQGAMGASWRVGVDRTEQTELVTGGVFALVRNPIFSCVMLTALGGALILPSAGMVAGLACLVLAIELQVRLVEEPHLARVHGDAYEAYRRRTGRFWPSAIRMSSRTRAVR